MKKTRREPERREGGEQSYLIVRDSQRIYCVRDICRSQNVSGREDKQIRRKMKIKLKYIVDTMHVVRESSIQKVFCEHSYYEYIRCSSSD